MKDANMNSLLNSLNRSLIAASILFSAICASAYGSGNNNSSAQKFGSLIHGGGGVRDRVIFAERPELEKAYLDTLTEALSAGHKRLLDGGSSVDAVEAAINVMEDSPLFNAGKGAAYTRDGTVELDSCIMNGKTLRAGGVGAVKSIKNPISLARMVMEDTPHVLLVAEGALAFAQEQGVEWVPQSYFYTERKWKDLIRRLKQNSPYGTKLKSVTATEPSMDPTQIDSGLFGTVGAVALDKDGNLAAGTSTGGRITKRPGRVGDSPIIGASTYANNNTCAVSTTGLGEKHMVLLTAKEISALMAYKDMSIQEAADDAMKRQLVAIGGGGGAIAMDKHGNIGISYTGHGMYRGYVFNDGEITVKIYKD